jgi:hypothetical protein
VTCHTQAKCRSPSALFPENRDLEKPELEAKIINFPTSKLIFWKNWESAKLPRYADEKCPQKCTGLTDRLTLFKTFHLDSAPFLM